MPPSHSDDRLHERSGKAGGGLEVSPLEMRGPRRPSLRAVTQRLVVPGPRDIE